MSYTKTEVGSIFLKGTIVVSDPSYELGTWCSKILTVKEGKWFIRFYRNEDAFKGHELVIEHETENKGLIPKGHVHNVLLGMDSGQIGIYDYSEYRNKAMIPVLREQGVCPPEHLQDSPNWFAYACTGEKPYKKVGNGVTCDSGYGDGDATLWVTKNDNKEIVRVGVNFRL